MDLTSHIMTLPGGHPEVLLDEVADDGQREERDDEDGGDVGDDGQGGDAE